MLDLEGEGEQANLENTCNTLEFDGNLCFVAGEYIWLDQSFDSLIDFREEEGQGHLENICNTLENLMEICALWGNILGLIDRLVVVMIWEKWMGRPIKKTYVMLWDLMDICALWVDVFGLINRLTACLIVTIITFKFGGKLLPFF